MIRFLLAAMTLVALSSNAEARQRLKSGLHPECFISMPCIAPYASTPDQVRVARGRYIARQVGFGAAIEKPVKQVRKPRIAKADYRDVIPSKPVQKITQTTTRVATTIVAHPEGCPRRLFCGCGAALRVFGSPVRDLWLAANWLRFPRAAPAPGMVAARRGHVFVLEADLGNGMWQVYDANSGRGLTRLHARSLAGYTVVNPRGGSA